ncbi:MAG TPA: hypothetical protein VHL78_08465 [Actinomycetota bacterium]|nr:hypothetical protein [Actinomycetota bacterium]
MERPRGRTLPSLRFRLAGIPVSVDLLFFVTALFLGTSAGRDGASLLVWVAVVLTSVLWHELGHALALRAFGYAPVVELWAFGGLTYRASGSRTPAGRFLVVTLAGPGAGLILGGTVLLWLRTAAPLDLGPLAEAAIVDVLWVNIGWAILNMIPILPLDGGNALASFLDLVTRGRGMLPARVVSVLLAGAGVVAAVLAREWWLALLAGFFLLTNASALRRPRRPAARAAPEER